MNVRKEEISARRWKELGFYYEFDESTKAECIYADRKGVSAFIEELRSYGNSKYFTEVGAHDHLGPYMALELRTCSCAGFEANLIHGLPDDFKRLAEEIERRMELVEVGGFLRLDNFGSESEVSLKIVLQPNGFDPSSMDKDAQ